MPRDVFRAVRARGRPRRSGDAQAGMDGGDHAEPQALAAEPDRRLTVPEGRQHVTFRQPARRAADRLKALHYDQTPGLDGPSGVLGRQVPWGGARRRQS